MKIVLMIFGFMGFASQCLSQSYLLDHVVIHTGNGTVIQDGAVGIRDGKITWVHNYAQPGTHSLDFDSVLNLKGQHLYPGFILLNSTLGLIEIEAVRATDDKAETGKFHPEVMATTAYNAASKIIPTLRLNGVLLAQVTPRGRFVAGQSGVVRLDGWHNQDVIVKNSSGLHVYWPERFAYAYREEDESGFSKTADEYKAELTQLLREAQHYAAEAGVQGSKILFALRQLQQQNATIFIHTHSARAMADAIHMFNTFGFSKLVMVGGDEAMWIKDLLRAQNIPVILSRLHDLPRTSDGSVYQKYTLPHLLTQAGIRVALDYSGDMEAMGARNLGFLAGTATAYGMDKEQALQLITSTPAQILGLDQAYGSIEPGKSATLFVSAGDALNMATQQVTAAWIDGKKIELSSHQTQLYQDYLKKYQLQAP